MMSYVRPVSLAGATELLAVGDHVTLMGGTDIYPAAGPALHGRVVDLTGIPELRGIEHKAGVRFGAATTWSQIADAKLPEALRCLQQAAAQVGGRQIQNAATLGGNLCNASPAADGVPPLLVVHAEVELASARGLRRLPLGEFLTGARRTALMSDEILVAIRVPQAAMAGRSAFLKLGARAHLVISIATAAVRIAITEGRITEAAVAVGACAAVAQRLPLVERALLGATPIEAAGRVRHSEVAQALSPIDDIRATAAYRLVAATELVRRAVAEAVG